MRTLMGILCVLQPTDLMRLTTTGMPYQTALVFNSNDAVPMNRSTMTTAELFAYSPMQMYRECPPVRATRLGQWWLLMLNTILMAFHA